MVGELGGPEHVPALLDLLKSADRSQDRSAVEQALAAVCTKRDDSQSQAEKLIRELDRAEPVQKAALIRVLAAIGGPKALEAVRAAAGGSNAEVRSAAVRGLSTWKTADAAGPLLALAKETNDPAEKTLFLRGYLKLAARRDLPTEQRLAMCRQAAGMIARGDEKRLLLGTLSNIESPRALSLIVPHLGDAATRQEAALAAVTLAERLLKSRNGGRHAASVVEALEKVTQAEINDNLARRAKTVLRQARNRAGNR
jgi:HEAT repeat protein